MDNKKKQFKELNETLKRLRDENEELELQILIARQEKIRTEKKAELERLSDPDEPAYRDECCRIPY